MNKRAAEMNSYSTKIKKMRLHNVPPNVVVLFYFAVALALTIFICYLHKYCQQLHVYTV
jgi:hypothetical protein